MMTKNDAACCDQILMAALARLDGEPADLTADEIDAHVTGCRQCEADIAVLRSVHADLGRVDYEHLDLDLWPMLAERVVGRAPRRVRQERRAMVWLTAVLVAWRLAQLVLDVPAPVVNSIVPLALIVIVLRKVAGDPFALRISSHQLQEKGAS